MSDLLDLGAEPRTPRRPPPQWWLVLAVAVVAAAGVGWLVGRQTSTPGHLPAAVVATPTSARRSSSTSATFIPSRIDITGGTCGVREDGGRLVLAVEIVNGGAAAVRVLTVRPSFPIGGLIALDPPTGSVRGVGCNHPLLSVTDTLAPGQQAWLGAAVQSTTTCPSPFPVQFEVQYVAADGITVNVGLAPFPDLGSVVPAC